MFKNFLASFKKANPLANEFDRKWGFTRKSFENGVLINGAAGSGKTYLSKKLLDFVFKNKTYDSFYAVSSEAQSLLDYFKKEDTPIAYSTELNVSFYFEEFSNWTPKIKAFLESCLITLQLSNHKSEILAQLDEIMYYESGISVNTLKKVCSVYPEFSNSLFERELEFDVKKLQLISFLDAEKMPSFILASDPFSSSLGKSTIQAVSNFINSLHTLNGQKSVFLFEDLNAHDFLTERAIKEQFYANEHLLIVSDQVSPLSFMHWFNTKFLFKQYSIADKYDFLQDSEKLMIKSLKIGECISVQGSSVRKIMIE